MSVLLLSLSAVTETDLAECVADISVLVLMKAKCPHVS